MDAVGQYSFLVASGLQVLAFLGLAGFALTRLGQRWAVVALSGAVVSLVPTLWFAVANLAIQSSTAGLESVEFFYSPPAQLLMQFLTVVGLALVVAAVVMGRGPRKEAPVEGPTGTTFRQLPSNIEWR
ncbi:hypothetical protein [Nocardioides sp. CFH 31398]|uniref:hypothetical protein n=1 Tax=Nocardioides sp. CFH 31398 TaxID=2919579 RepID=UPI001F064B54|nr:hypothetical protein [Nocardioides sp. CFH 31398]MCH1865954.1 hypothetical protein [Nocardioides sp. CFH 31398]